MNLRRRKPHDSLYMLLDTMCNAFGGIILLAVLVTLLTRQERDTPGTASDTQEMVQRRLAMAKGNLKEALQLQASLRAKADDGQWKAQVSLLEKRRQLQNDIQAIRDLTSQSAKDLESSASSDPTERMKSLNAQFAAAQARKLDAQNSLAASNEKAKLLKARLVGLEKQATDLVNESQRQVRLPREHETGKTVIYIIARYGRIYPCRNSDLSRNETDIQWTSTGSGETAEPRASRGIDPANAAALRTYFRTLSGSSSYVAFCVFEDSFPAFIHAKQLASESGLAFGWEPFRLSDGAVSFGPVGHTPKPQ